MKKIEDLKARKAAETLRKYCNEHKFCKGCIFSTRNTCANCLLVNKLPFDWIK